MPATKGPSPVQWASLRSVISELYYEDDLSLKETAARMESDHGFHATPKMYKKRFAEWGLRKNISSEEAVKLLLAEGHSDALISNPLFNFGNRPVTTYRLRRHLRKAIRDKITVDTSESGPDQAGPGRTKTFDSFGQPESQIYGSEGEELQEPDSDDITGRLIEYRQSRPIAVPGLHYSLENQLILQPIPEDNTDSIGFIETDSKNEISIFHADNSMHPALDLAVESFIPSPFGSNGSYPGSDDFHHALMFSNEYYDHIELRNLAFARIDTTFCGLRSDRTRVYSKLWVNLLILSGYQFNALSFHERSGGAFSIITEDRHPHGLTYCFFLVILVSMRAPFPGSIRGTQVVANELHIESKMCLGKHHPLTRIFRLLSCSAYGFQICEALLRRTFDFFDKRLTSGRQSSMNILTEMFDVIRQPAVFDEAQLERKFAHWGICSENMARLVVKDSFLLSAANSCPEGIDPPLTLEQRLAQEIERGGRMHEEQEMSPWPTTCS